MLDKLRAYFATLGNDNFYNTIIEPEIPLANEQIIEVIAIQCAKSHDQFSVIDFAFDESTSMSNETFFALYGFILHNTRFIATLKHVPQRITDHFNYLKENLIHDSNLFEQNATRPPLSAYEVSSLRLAGKIASIPLHCQNRSLIVVLNYVETEEWCTKLISSICRLSRPCRTGVIILKPSLMMNERENLEYHNWSVRTVCRSFL
jgi:hypothetical protein